MNNKLVAILAVVAFIAAGTTAAVAVPSEAEGEYNLGTTYVAKGGSSTVPLYFNENAYTSYHYYSFTMKASTTSGNFTSVTPFFSAPTGTGQSAVAVGDSGITVEASRTSETTHSSFDIKLSAGGNATVGSYTVYIQLVVSVCPVAGNNQPIELDAFEYKVTVNVRETGTTTGTDVTFVRGVSGSQTVLDNNTIKGVTYTEWYAVGLPKGLNIGVESGAVVIKGLTNDSATTETGKDLTIVGYDTKTGSEVTIKIKIVIEEGEQIKYSISDAERIGDTETWVSKYVDEQITKPTLSITGDGTYTVTAIDQDSGTYDRIPIDGTKADDGYEYTLPVDGFGVYTIEMTYNGLTTTATLHILPVTVGAGAGFIVVGSP